MACNVHLYKVTGPNTACTSRANFVRSPYNSGIALGPILFIIAILAILAAAIAAGSGSFSATTNSDSNKTKASALLQIGDQLKVGIQRLTYENGVGYNNWTINTANTINTNDMFSPLGGGIVAPSTTMAGANTDKWYYPQGAIPGIGTYSNNSSNTIQLAVLNVAQGVCAEINNRANNMNDAPKNNASADMGNFAAAQGTSLGSGMTSYWPLAGSANWMSANTTYNLYGKPVGCLYNADAGSTGWFFYEVLVVQ